MKKFRSILIGVVLTALLAFGAAAQDTMTTKKPAKKAETPQTDPDIQKCIMERAAKAASLKDTGVNASVSNGVATLTGKVATSGAKGAATRIAKACGAKQVTNNIEAPAVVWKKKAVVAAPAAGEPKKP